MESLSTLNNLGLPGWLVSIATIIFIVKQIGLWDFFYSHLADKREHSQASENVAIEVLREVNRESIHEHSKEMSEFRDIILRLTRRVDDLSRSIRELAGIIADDK